MFCKLFLWFFAGIFIGTLAYNVPANITNMTSNDFDGYRVFENPFMIYVDFVKLANRCVNATVKPDSFHGECICYWGFEAPKVQNATELEILKRQLSPKETEMFNWHEDNNFNISGETLVKYDDDCHLDPHEIVPTFYDYKNHDGERNDEKGRRFNALHQGYAGKTLNVQRVCISAVPQSKQVRHDFPTVEWYDITILTTGNGYGLSSHYSKIQRRASEGYLQLQFNTKMPVLQSFGEIPNSPHQFIVIPQIAPIQAFDFKQQTAAKIVIEDTFVEMKLHSCSADGSYGVFFYSPDDLKNTQIVDKPPNVKGYIGAMLLPNGSSVGEMIKRNQTAAQDILYKEISYYLNKKF